MVGSIAFAMGTGGQGATDEGTSNFFMTMFPLILIFVIFYFLLIRPQMKRQKQHREMIENLKKGDKVTTSGGIYGTIETLSPTTVTLRIADNVKIKVTRSSIAAVRSRAEED